MSKTPLAAPTRVPAPAYGSRAPEAQNYVQPLSRAARPPEASLSEREAPARPWLTYRDAATYCGWSVAHLRNLVSAGQIPVYGKPRMRRFRRDMLDLFLTNPDAAMRSFRAERNAHGG